MNKLILFSLSFFSTTLLFNNCTHWQKSSRMPSAAYGNIDGLKSRFVEDSDYDLEEAKTDSFGKFVNQFNRSILNKNTDISDDWIDYFLSALPDHFKRHYTFVHRSYSIQDGTPLSPRVIMFSPDARTIMTFNAGTDLKGQKQRGGNSIEVIEWNASQLHWDFAELGYSGRAVTVKRSPKRCVMCHSGTPKAVLESNAEYYRTKLKPIFPQYPLWPGFYGSVNDIIGLPERPGSRDTIMANESDTRKHIEDFLFGDSEEQFRLRKALDNNPKYMDVVLNEMDVHQKYFLAFKNGAENVEGFGKVPAMKERRRYKHLIQLEELYTSRNEEVPEFLKAAPYRRTFDKEYGHYILRPNFYVSTLMSLYHAQAIAREIDAFPEFDKMKYSLLAAKLNCDPNKNLSGGGLKLDDLNPSFDLVYPNVATQEDRDRQYLLAYQYNLVNGAKSDKAYLPLFAWNLESNEEIASYHYGNVFSDLNELVLWNLGAMVFDGEEGREIFERGRTATEARHMELKTGEYFEREIADMGNVISRITNSQYAFATTPGPYYGRRIDGQRFNGQPVSRECKHIIAKVPDELRTLADLKEEGELPHQLYPIDEKLLDIPHVMVGPVALNGTRQACESCHASGIMEPRFNTDWHSDGYTDEVKKDRDWFRNPTRPRTTLAEQIKEVLDGETLPVPFGSQMPYARRAMDPFSLTCELKLVQNAYNFNGVAKDDWRLFEQKFNCPRVRYVDPDTGKTRTRNADNLTAEQEENCKCRSLYIRKASVFNKYYHPEDR